MKRNYSKLSPPLASKRGCDINLGLFENEIWLDTVEAASYLRISVNSLRIRISRGQVIPFRLGKRLRFKKSQLDNLITASFPGAKNVY